MKFNITTSLTQQQLTDLVKTVDETAVISVHHETATEQEFFDLCAQIKESNEFDHGLFTGVDIERVKNENIVFSLEVVNQIRYNGANVGLIECDSTTSEQVFFGVGNSTLSEENVDSVQCVWMNYLHGDLLEYTDEVLVIMAFGKKPDQVVIDSMLNGDIKLTNFTDEEVKTIFTDYDGFVNSVLNRELVFEDQLFEVDEGYDS